MEKENMSTETLTHRIPKESLSLRQTISFHEARKRVDALVNDGSSIDGACKRVFKENTIVMLRASLGNFKSAELFRSSIYSLSNRLRRRAKERRQAKKGGTQERVRPTANVAATAISSDYRAFHASVRGIMDMPLSAIKKIEVIKAIL